VVVLAIELTLSSGQVCGTILGVFGDSTHAALLALSIRDPLMMEALLIRMQATYSRQCLLQSVNQPLKAIIRRLSGIKKDERLTRRCYDDAPTAELFPFGRIGDLHCSRCMLYSQEYTGIFWTSDTTFISVNDHKRTTRH
jgi:hypothetical protein